MKLLPNLLDIEFESPVWEKWGGKCFSCGSCAMVCPTCYCYGVSEQVSMDFTRGAKVKQLYSCNLVDFAVVAGGHNFRPAAARRGSSTATITSTAASSRPTTSRSASAADRCGRVCLAGINPPDVIRDLQEEEARI